MGTDPALAEMALPVQQGLTAGHRIALLVISLLMAALIIDLVRRSLLKERYALLWLATSLLGLLVGVFPGIITGLSRLLHFQYLTLVFVLSFAFLLGLVLSFSIVISRTVERNRELTQEVAILANAIAKLERELHAQQRHE